MKYIVLSFDDARSDTYEIALPIMQRYGLVGTVNIISDYVLHPDHYHFVTSSKAMTAEQVRNWQKCGGEIACHGSTHKNTAEDIKRNIDELKIIGVNTDNIGFASPSSWLTLENIESSGIFELKKKGILSYLRSGIQIRREGKIYTIFSVIEQLTHSKRLYYFLNRRNITLRNQKYDIYPSAAIKDFTTLEQVQYIVNKVNNEDALIIMLHSVLKREDEHYGKDHYYWDAGCFDNLCKWLKEKSEIQVITMKALCKMRGDFID